MDKIHINGGIPLKGKVKISGAKNAALPLMAASILSSEPLTLSNIPHLSDITTMANLLVYLGVDLHVDGRNDNGNCGRILTLNGHDVNDICAPYEIVRKMRASIVVMGPLLARFGRAEISLPGGCAIGARPIDLHLHALEKMGAKVELKDGYVKVGTQDGKLRGADITFEKVSVGATENSLMAASLAFGTTILRNAAKEPEVSDLAQCLVKMGAKIQGIGTDTLTIEGVEKLSAAQHSVLPDRIEAGTYAIAAAITGGKVTINGINPEILQSTLDILKQSGVNIFTTENSVTVDGVGNLQPVDVETEPYPGFPTDMQAQLVALMSLAQGTSHISEHIFENRFMHIPELQRMGADIKIEGNQLTIKGVESFHGAEVMATDLRASVAMVLAALQAKEQTTISRVYHIDRGYERIEEKLCALGANIVRAKDV